MMSQESKHSVKTPQRQSLAALLSLALYFGLPYRFHVGGGEGRGLLLRGKKMKASTCVPSLWGSGQGRQGSPDR